MGDWPGKGQGNFGCQDADECQVGHIDTEQQITD